MNNSHVHVNKMLAEKCFFRSLTTSKTPIWPTPSVIWKSSNIINKAWQFKRAHVHFLHNCRALGNCSLLNEITEGIDVWRKSRTETRSGVVLLWLLAINKQTNLLLEIKTQNKWRTPATVQWRHVSKKWNINSKVERFTKKTTSCTVEFHAESNYNKIDPRKWKLCPPSVLQAFGPIKGRAGIWKPLGLQ